MSETTLPKQAQEADTLQAFDTIVQLPPRPGRCSIGNSTSIMANSFVVNLQNLDKVIYYYELKVDPEPRGLQARFLFNMWKELYFDVMNLPGPCYFDGKRTLLTSTQLTFDPPTVTEQNYQIMFPMTTRVANKRTRIVKQFTLTIKHVASLQLNDLQNYLLGKITTENSIFSYTSAVDIVFRQVACAFLSPQGRVLFDRRQKKSSANGTVVLQGYTQAIRTAESRLLLIIDSTTALFYEEHSILRFIEFGLQRQNIDALTQGEIHMLERAVRGIRVYADHSAESDRPEFTIHAITTEPCHQVMLVLAGQPGPVSVVQHYAQEFQRVLRFPNLPCVVHLNAAGQQEYIPLECCVVSPNQKVTRPFGAVDIKQYKPSALRPAERAAQVEAAIRMLYAPLPAPLATFGLAPSYTMLHIDAHVLPPPTLRFHAESKVPTVVPAAGRWNMEHHRVYAPVTLTHWAVLPFVVCEPDLIPKFLQRWTFAMTDMGILVKNRTPHVLPAADPKAGIESAIQHAYLKAGNETVHPDLLVFILPDRCVASQCITLPILKTVRPKHLENLCLKLNVKLPGGTNVCIAPEELSPMMSVPTIFMGADVTHPSLNADSPSIASVVASMNLHASKYIAVSRIQPLRAEIILDMGSMVLELLQQFYAATGTKPQRILFYRDGISEGQFSEVLRSEVIAIRKACKALDPTYQPKLTFMVVQKRHHTRFYPGSDAEMDPKSGNLLPGLTVDSVITHPFEFDFYIQSHLGQQGLVKPTRYAVLVDENKFDANDLMLLSYHLCYLYPRGARSVSMVPPAFFAHVCAARAKAHVVSGEKDGHRYFALAMVKPELEKSMYFM